VTFVKSDGFPGPARAAGMGLAARKPRLAPGERTTGPFPRVSGVVRIGVGRGPLVEEDAVLPRDSPGQKARRTVPIGCAPMLGLVWTASIELDAKTNAPCPGSRSVEFEGCETLACTGRRPAGLSYPRRSRAGDSCLGDMRRSVGTGVAALGSWDFVVAGRDSHRRCSATQLGSVGMERLPVRGRDSAIGDRSTGLVGAAAAAAGWRRNSEVRPEMGAGMRMGQTAYGARHSRGTCADRETVGSGCSREKTAADLPAPESTGALVAAHVVVVAAAVCSAPLRKGRYRSACLGDPF
jgi:hypothetical protein